MQRPSDALDWNEVQLFLALCRARTLGGAARSLGVDGSTVSRRLTALERLLGATLFDRSRDGIAPTSAAEELMPIAEETEASVHRFANAVDRLETEVTGVVRVTCPPDTAEVILLPLLRVLVRRHPRLRLAIEPSEAVLDLARREADLALRIARPVQGDLLVRRLREVRWVLAASPEYAKRLGPVRQWDQLSWVGWGERFAQGGAARWLREQVPGAEPVVSSDSLSVQLAAVRAGLGAALIPEPSLDHFRLSPVSLAPRLRDAASRWPVDELFLVTHRALRNVPRVRAVWEALVSRLADPQAKDEAGPR